MRLQINAHILLCEPFERNGGADEERERERWQAARGFGRGVTTAALAVAWVSDKTWRALLNHAPGVSWHHAASPTELSRGLDQEDCCGVVEVGYRGNPRVEAKELVECLRETTNIRLVLLITLGANVVREAMAYRVLDDVELFVLGSDPLSELSKIVSRIAGRPARDPIITRLRQLTGPLATVMLAAAQQPSEWPLKRILAEAGVARSTLERRMQALGLPSPGRLLRHLSLAAARRDQRSA